DITCHVITVALPAPEVERHGHIGRAAIVPAVVLVYIGEAIQLHLRRQWHRRGRLLRVRRAGGLLGGLADGGDLRLEHRILWWIEETDDSGAQCLDAPRQALFKRRQVIDQQGQQLAREQDRQHAQPFWRGWAAATVTGAEKGVLHA